MANHIICSVDGCGKAAKSRGWCNTHYERWRHNGGPTAFAASRTMMERFTEKYVVVESGCWIWTACKGEHGYGLFGTGGSGRSEMAHRSSYKLHKGPIPPGILVCHRCDTPPCVNPDHLFLGTSQDNMTDAKNKKRMASGERSGVSRLTNEAVNIIRTSTLSERKIAAVLGVHRGTVNAVRSGRTWKEVKS